MNKTLIFAFVLASTASLTPAHAQTYQWKDGNGKTVISDTPPPASARGSRSIGVHQPAVVTEKPAESTAETKAAEAAEASAPLSTAEKDMEFRKRQQEAREKAEKDAKEAAALRDRRETCERARQNYRALQSTQPVLQYDQKGERQLMDNRQRQQELERTRRIMQEACK
ncbi:hypothetical protein BJN45_07475 [Azonexus hydrophilus]|uniref:DUF4124 domain-containing protein n=2 Tax=Azonexus hydrophilus TaxID=418702 RepID=A0A1R1I8H6_9RHOO|nr:hypothetical protein BJN45_07475 [Azonexus hydrophilus]